MESTEVGLRHFTGIHTRVLIAALVVSAALDGAAPLYSIRTVAGSGNNGDGGPAALAFVSIIEGVCGDTAGNVYLADADDNRIRKIDPSGIITTYAGTGAPGFGGDGGPATRALLQSPYGIKLDSSGNLFIADLGNGRIREVTVDGRITTVAAGLAAPRNLAFDPNGTLYVAEFAGHRVSRIQPDGSRQPIAGTGMAGYAGDGGSALAAQLSNPAGIAFDAFGALFIADSGNQQIRKVTPDGIISTVMGTGALGPGNAIPLSAPTGVTTDVEGDLYVVNALVPCVREMTTDGVIRQTIGAGLDVFATAGGDLLIAGEQHLEVLDASGKLTQTVGADSHTFGDGGPAVDARFESIGGVALVGTSNSNDNLVIADPVFRTLREVASNGNIDGLQASDYMTRPSALAVDPTGRLFVADGSTIKIANPIGTSAVFLDRLIGPQGLAFDTAGNLYFTDGAGLYMASPAAVVQRLSPGAALKSPTGVAVEAGTGNVYVADTGNHAIRRISPSGAIATVAGNGTAGFAGDGGSATSAQLSYPMGLALDGAGNLWIADSGNNRIRAIDSGGVIRTAAGNGLAGFYGDTGNATGAQLSSPTAVVCDGQGDVYVADSGNRRVRILSPGAGAILPTIGVATLTNAATFLANPIVGGEIVSIFGENGGDAIGLGAQFDSSGKLATQLGGTSVLFDGVPAPLYYAGPGQINAEVPVEVAGHLSALVEVQHNGVTQTTADVDVAPYDPGLFASASHAAALNQDLSVNGPDRPATAGSVIVLFGTGFGSTQPLDVTGVPAQPPLGIPIAFVTVSIGGMPADVLFVGDAPGFVGLTQINARIPAGVAGQPQVLVGAGNAVSPAGVAIYVR